LIKPRTGCPAFDRAWIARRDAQAPDGGHDHGIVDGRRLLYFLFVGVGLGAMFFVGVGLGAMFFVNVGLGATFFVDVGFVGAALAVTPFAGGTMGLG
jgi:hypothetical protein